MTYILPGNLTKLDPFTLRMMEDVLRSHATVTDHGDGYCCEVADQYLPRVRAHYSIIADEEASRGVVQAVENPLTESMARYVRGLYKKCPAHLLSPLMREQAEKVVKGEEIPFDAASALIDAMKAVVDGPSVPRQRDNVRRITPAMVGYLRTLLAQREHDEDADPDRLEEMPFQKASEMIGRLKAAPFKKEPKAARRVPEDGFYVVEGIYYKVITSERTGHPSARMWDADSESWEYVGQRPFRFLTKDHEMSVEQAARFGALFHRCVFCTKQLTRKESEDVGYGPDCADQRGLPWG